VRSLSLFILFSYALPFKKPLKDSRGLFGDNASLGDHCYLLPGFQMKLFPHCLRDHYLEFWGYGCARHAYSFFIIDNEIVKQLPALSPELKPGQYSVVKAITEKLNRQKTDQIQELFRRHLGGVLRILFRVRSPTDFTDLIDFTDSESPKAQVTTSTHSTDQEQKAPVAQYCLCHAPT
jgi:hypothetical protein